MVAIIAPAFPNEHRWSARNKIKKGRGEKRRREKREISMRTKVANYFPAITGVHSRRRARNQPPYAHTSPGVRMIPSADRSAGTR